jgi:hypothetical protein
MPAGTKYTVPKGMLSDQIENVDLDRDGRTDHYLFRVKNHFLHAVHPVGWIKKLVIEIDGKTIDADKAYFVLRGQWFQLTKMYTISEVFWNLCETAAVYVACDGGMKPGRHSVKCTFIMSMLEDTHILDTENKWPFRTETVENVMEA